MISASALCEARIASLDRPRQDEDLNTALPDETAAVLCTERHPIESIAAQRCQIDARSRGSPAEIDCWAWRIDRLYSPAQIEHRKLILEIARRADKVGLASKQDCSDIGL